MLLAALQTMPTAAAADVVETRLLIAPTVVVDLAQDRPAEDVAEVWTRIDAGAEGRTDRGRWVLGVRGEHQVWIGLPEDGGDLEAGVWVAPGESGWTGPVGAVELRAGLFIERWGNLDLVPVADVLNGRDLRAGFTTPPAWQRLPAPLLRVGGGGEHIGGSVVVLPFGAQDAAALWGSDTAIIRQGMAEGLAAEMSTWPGDGLTEDTLQAFADALSQSLGDLDPQLRRGLDAGLAQAGRPRPLDEAVDVAARMTAEGRGWDIAISAAWLRNRQPAPVASEALVGILRSQSLPGIADTDELLAVAAEPLTSEWPRTWFGAVEGSTTVGPFGVRGEAGAWSARTVPQQWLRATTSPAVAGGIGLDWTPSTAAMVALEARYDRLLDAPDDPLMVAEEDLSIGLLARASVARERVELTAGGLYSVAFGEFIVRPGVAWRVSDAVRVSTGAVVLTGGPDTPTTLLEALSHDGGPASYWGDTDAVTATVEWIR